MKIPRKFYHTNEETPVAETVGVLIEILRELPPDLRIAQGFGEGVECSVYNYDEYDCFLEFEEVR